MIVPMHCHGVGLIGDCPDVPEWLLAVDGYARASSCKAHLGDVAEDVAEGMKGDVFIGLVRLGRGGEPKA